MRSKFRTIWGVEAKCGKVTNFAHYFGFDVDKVYLLQRKCTVQLTTVAELLHTVVGTKVGTYGHPLGQ